jgi:hypothetical protein
MRQLVFPTPYNLSANSTVVDVSEPRNQEGYVSLDRLADHYRACSITWCLIRNAYYMHFGGILINRTIYYDWKDNQIFDPHSFPPAFVVTPYDVVFNFLHRWPAFGHYLIDFFPVLTVVSDEFKRDAYFIVREKIPFVCDAIRLFNIRESHLLGLGPTELVFAQEMYVVRPLQWEKMNALMIEHMRAIFAEELGLDKAPPYRYVLDDRPTRRVTNSGEVLRHVRDRFPSTKFEVYEDQLIGKMKEIIHYFNEILLIVGYHGSGLLNVVFQQTNTVMIVIDANDNHPWIFPPLARILKRHLFLCRDKKVGHGSSSRAMPLEQVLPLLDRAIEKAHAIGRHYVPFRNLFNLSKPLLVPPLRLSV